MEWVYEGQRWEQAVLHASRSKQDGPLYGASKGRWPCLSRPLRGDIEAESARDEPDQRPDYVHSLPEFAFQTRSTSSRKIALSATKPNPTAAAYSCETTHARMQHWRLDVRRCRTCRIHRLPCRYLDSLCREATENSRETLLSGYVPIGKELFVG